MIKLIKYFITEKKRKDLGIPSQKTDSMTFVLDQDYIHPVSKKRFKKGCLLYPYSAAEFRPAGTQGGSDQMFNGIPYTVKHKPNIFDFY